MIVTDIETFMIDFGDDKIIQLTNPHDTRFSLGVFKIHDFIELKDDYLIGVCRVHKDLVNNVLIEDEDIDYFKLSDVHIIDITRTFLDDINISHGLEIKETEVN